MTLQEIIEQSLRIASEEIKSELMAQGHNNTGALINSIEGIVRDIEGGIRGELYMLERYIYINNPTPSSRIPYGGRTGAGGTSKYIQGLIEFFKSKGAQDPKAAAFATAAKHKKEGRPTRGSYLFSNNGRRLGFLEASIIPIRERVYAQLEKDIEQYIELQVFNKIAN